MGRPNVNITVFVPTLDRPSLSTVLDQIGKQTDSIRIVRGLHPVSQISVLLKSETSELIGIVDDDSIPSDDWLQVAASYFQDPSVAYVCGPLIDRERNYPQIVQESFLGSFLMRDRYRFAKTSEVSELKIHGMGVYRRRPLALALDELGDIDLPGWENKIVTVMRRDGWKVIRTDQLASGHPSRSSLLDFFKQKFKEGRGRGSYFRTFPREMIRKPFFFFPILPLILIFIWPVNLYCLVAYIGLVIMTTGSIVGIPWFLANHVGYALGLLRGLLP